jgi:hypothetical protein
MDSDAVQLFAQIYAVAALHSRWRFFCREVFCDFFDKYFAPSPQFVRERTGGQAPPPKFVRERPGVCAPPSASKSNGLGVNHPPPGCSMSPHAPPPLG